MIVFSEGASHISSSFGHYIHWCLSWQYLFRISFIYWVLYST